MEQAPTALAPNSIAWGAGGKAGALCWSSGGCFPNEGLCWCPMGSLFVSLVLFPLYGSLYALPSSHVPCILVCPRAAERILTRCAASAMAEDLPCPGRDCSCCQMLMPRPMREKLMRCWQLPALRRGEDQALGTVPGGRGGGALCLHPDFGGGQREMTSRAMLPLR